MINALIIGNQNQRFDMVKEYKREIRRSLNRTVGQPGSGVEEKAREAE